MTFTNKAAREMQERVRKLIPAPRKQSRRWPVRFRKRPTICTFHSLCVRIFRRHIEKLGYKSNFVIYDQSEQLSAIKKILIANFRQRRKDRSRAVLSHAKPLQKRRRERCARLPIQSVRALAQHIRARYESAFTHATPWTLTI